MKRTDFRALNSQAQEEVRKQSVRAVLSGKTQEEAAELFGVTRQAVCGWMALHREGGEKALQARKKGRPKGGKLKPSQSTRIARVILDKVPDQLKLPFCLWTREAIGMLIERKLGIQCSVWTVGRYVKQWGFTPQKPLRRAYEQNPGEVRRWLEREYPKIRARAKADGATIYWGDEMGLRSDHATGTTMGMKGHTPVMPGTGQRFRCNMISVLTNRGQMLFMVFKNGFNGSVFLGFLNRMHRQVRKKAYLIIDSHPVHRSRKVKRWLKGHPRFRVFYLPAYSPELNPDELLNHDVKSNAVGRKRARHQDEMVRNVRGHLRSRQRSPEIVRNFFKEEHVRYAAV